MTNPQVSEERLAQLPIILREPKQISEKEEKYLRQIDTYEFYNLENSNVIVKFPYGNTRHKHVFTFMHGGKYRLPRFIAQWVESCGEPNYKWQPDGSGKMQRALSGLKPRFQMRHVFN